MYKSRSLHRTNRLTVAFRGPRGSLFEKWRVSYLAHPYQFTAGNRLHNESSAFLGDFNRTFQLLVVLVVAALSRSGVRAGFESGQGLQRRKEFIAFLSGH